MKTGVEDQRNGRESTHWNEPIGYLGKVRL